MQPPQLGLCHFLTVGPLCPPCAYTMMLTPPRGFHEADLAFPEGRSFQTSPHEVTGQVPCVYLLG